MRIDWQLRNSWNTDRDAAYEEAVRRIARCVERREERLYLGDVTLDRLPKAISSLTWLRELDLYGSPIASLEPLAPLIDPQDFQAGSLHRPSLALDVLSGCRELRATQAYRDDTTRYRPASILHAAIPPEHLMQQTSR